ncbi:MAG: hypothetical protein ACTSU5_02235 [Promethearchaeota archaeon]
MAKDLKKTPVRPKNEADAFDFEKKALLYLLAFKFDGTDYRPFRLNLGVNSSSGDVDAKVFLNSGTVGYFQFKSKAVGGNFPKNEVLKAMVQLYKFSEDLTNRENSFDECYFVVFEGTSSVREVQPLKHGSRTNRDEAELFWVKELFRKFQGEEEPILGNTELKKIQYFVRRLYFFFIPTRSELKTNLSKLFGGDKANELAGALVFDKEVTADSNPEFFADLARSRGSSSLEPRGGGPWTRGVRDVRVGASEREFPELELQIFYYDARRRD